MTQINKTRDSAADKWNWEICKGNDRQEQILHDLYQFNK